MDEPAVAKPRGMVAKSKPRPQPNDIAGLGGPRRDLEVAECHEGGITKKIGRSKPNASGPSTFGVGLAGDFRIQVRRYQES